MFLHNPRYSFYGDASASEIMKAIRPLSVNSWLDYNFLLFALQNWERRAYGGRLW
jgi:hypothetical protein